MPESNRPLRCEPLEDRVTPALGDLDLTFGDGGRTDLAMLDRFGNTFSPLGTAAQPDGKILVVGTFSSDMGVARLTTDGKLDPSFGGTGFVTLGLNLGGYHRDVANAVAVQPDGRIVIVGSADLDRLPNGPLVRGPRTPSAFAAVRLTADGALDPTFGSGGKVAVQFVSEITHTAVAKAVALQPDGRIVLAGYDADGLFGDYAPLPPTSFAAIRLLPNGALDPSFDGDGKLIIPFPVGEVHFAQANAVAVQSDGGIVLAGGATNGSRPQVDLSIPDASAEDFAVARLTADGELDPGFGDGGRVRIPFDLAGRDVDADVAKAVSVQTDGRIVLAGWAQGRVAITHEYAAARLLPNGALDLSFDGDGKVNGRITGVLTVAILRDGQLVFADDFTDPREGLGTKLVRLTVDGTVDPSFGVTPVFRLYPESSPSSVMLTEQPDGNLVLIGKPIDYTPPHQPTIAYRVIGRQPAIPVAPGSAAIGGTSDGAARVFFPTAGGLEPGGPASFGFTGTVRTAVGDVNGDGVPDLIGGSGPGDGSTVRVIDGKTGTPFAPFFAFETSFTGGVFVSAGDIDGDGKAEVVVSPDQGGGPVVAIYDGAKLSAGLSGDAAQFVRFFGIADESFRGGARPAIGDVNADGKADLAVVAGFLGGPRVALFSGQQLATRSAEIIAAGGKLDGSFRLVGDFFAFEDTLRNGAFVSLGDTTGDGKADLTFGGGPGGAPRVRLFDGAKLLAAGAFQKLDEVAGVAQAANFFAGDASLRGGVRLALCDTDADGKADLVTGSGEGEPSRVRVYKAANLLANPNPTQDQLLDPYGATLANGVFVG